MPNEAMFEFIEKCANNEMFRTDLIANPAEVLATAGLEEEDLRSIKQDESLGLAARPSGNTPPDW